MLQRIFEASHPAAVKQGGAAIRCFHYLQCAEVSNHQRGISTTPRGTIPCRCMRGRSGCKTVSNLQCTEVSNSQRSIGTKAGATQSQTKALDAWNMGPYAAIGRLGPSH